MNAYELADELENYVWMNPNNNRDYCKEVKDMLRQHADEIQGLKALCKNNLRLIPTEFKKMIELKYTGEQKENFLKHFFE